MRTSWIVILFLLAALCDAVAAGRSGEVAPLARNRALESNEAVGETVLGMRSSDGLSDDWTIQGAHTDTTLLGVGVVEASKVPGCEA